MRKQVTLEGKIVRIGGYSADVHICVLLLDAGQGPARPLQFHVPMVFAPYVALLAAGDVVRLSVEPASSFQMGWKLTDISSLALGPVAQFNATMPKQTA